jgi:Right handed beta helix region
MWTMIHASSIWGVVFGNIGGHGIVNVACCAMFLFAPIERSNGEDGLTASQTLYVRADAPNGGSGQDWSSAFNDLTDALDAAAVSGGQVDQIWVAQGMYVPSRGSISNDPRTWTFQLVGGVDVFGGFAGNETLLEQRDWVAHPTILSGDILGDDESGFVNNIDNVRHVVSADRLEISRAGIDGFGITGGNAAGRSANFNHSGGGLRLFSSKVGVRNCRIYGNSSNARGGGLFVHSGEVVLFNCDVEANRSSSGGGLYTQFSVTIRACAFRDNFTWTTASGPGGLEVGRDSLIISSVIEGNVALNGNFGGILITDRAWMINCLVVGNSAPSGRGGGVGATASARIVNSIIMGNFGRVSGGVYVAGTSPLEEPSIINSIIAFNEGDRDIGGIEIGGNIAPRIANSIVWRNEAVAIPSQQVQISGSVNPRIDWSCVQLWDGSFGGTGNFGDNPMFVDPFGPDGIRGTEDDDLRIQRNSPCQETGDNIAVPQDAGDLDGDGNVFEPTPLDFAGEPRFRCDLGRGARATTLRVDVGAHEFQPPRCVANFNDDCELDIFDFLAFQNAFVLRQPRADIDQSTGVGVFDIFDFLAYQSQFVVGCP